MAKAMKPGSNTGKSGGIFQQVSPAGNPLPKYAAVPDNRPLPPTAAPGGKWMPLKITPSNKRP